MNRAMRGRRADEEVATRKPDAGTLGTAVDEVRRAPQEDVAPLANAVSMDWGKEREADAVADAATQDFDGPVLDGDRLSGGLQAAMRTAAPNLEQLDQVRFDQSADATAANDSIGALAFTRGNDVAVGRDQMTAHTAAHEAAHASMHADDGMVHAKMRGARAAIGDLGGGKTTKKGLIEIKTNWDRILDGVGAYEALEETLLSGGNPSPEVLKVAKPKLLKTLKAVRADIKSWEKANDSKGEQKKSEGWTKKLSESGERPETDDRAKAERRQAISMLLPRVNNEISLLESKDPAAWTNSLGLSTEKIGAKGRTDEGQKNKVSELTYQTESGEFSGFFKQDKGFAQEMEAHEADTGIQIADPNYGARSVAMYKLDKLFNAGVTARAEFATNIDESGKTVFGTVLESAKGTKGANVKIGSSQEHAKQLGQDAFSLDDPVFQSCMNKLQIFDAICGQLDRHDGNYYVQIDENNQVTGITGIDLDMAFGKDLKGDMKAGKAAPNFKGIPDKIDKTFGEALLRVSSKDVEDALRGLLSKEEIAATIERFEAVKTVVRQLQQSQSLVAKWDDTTTSDVQSTDLKYSWAKEGYDDNVALGSLVTISNQIQELAVAALGSGQGPSPFQASQWTREMASLPDTTKQLIVDGIAGAMSFGALTEQLRHVAYAEKIGEQIPELTMLVVNELLRDHKMMSTLAVMVQEKRSITGSEIGGAAKEAIANVYIPKAKARLPKKKPTGGVRPSEEGRAKGRTSMIGSRGRR